MRGVSDIGFGYLWVLGSGACLGSFCNSTQRAGYVKVGATFLVSNIGALFFYFELGFRGPLYYNCNKEPPK